MNKQIFIILTVVSIVFGFSTMAKAQSACGGVVQLEPDCGNTSRNWHFSCCPDGYRVQGVAYNDIKKQDHVDAIGAVCRSISAGNMALSEDFSRRPKEFVCDKTELLIGIATMDVKTEAGDDRDTLDGATAICWNPKTHQERMIANNDITERALRTQKVIGGKQKVVGIAYKEINRGSSDRADCATVIIK